MLVKYVKYKCLSNMLSTPVWSSKLQIGARKVKKESYD